MHSSNQVTFEQDEYVRERFERTTRWVATLSNGCFVYEDDNRPGLLPNSWLRLKNYLEENQHLKIVGLYLQFRSHIERVPDNADGYYLSKGAGVYFGGSISPTIQYMITGTLSNDIVHCTWWQCPELQIEKHTQKTIDEEIVQKCLIRNPK